MSKKPLEAIEEDFSKVSDPRKDRTKDHKKIDIIAKAICAIICGAEGWTDMEIFGNSKVIWLKTFLALRNGIPSHDTWSALELGQRKVDEKSNEITAIPELLKQLNLSVRIVTIDAMGTQSANAKTIQEGNADYVLRVKKNQGHHFEDISVLLGVDQEQNFKYALLDYQKTVNKGHGRIEVRECWSASNPEYPNLIRGVQNWVGLRSNVMVVSTRIIEGKERKFMRYYISSLLGNVERILQVVGKHWAIENELHWILDVDLKEDRSRVRKDQTPENLAVLRHIALNLLKQEKTAKGGTRAKQFQAALKED
jgi:predicted transposase YbfD/YdcC